MFFISFLLLFFHHCNIFFLNQTKRKNSSIHFLSKLKPINKYALQMLILTIPWIGLTRFMLYVMRYFVMVKLNCIYVQSIVYGILTVPMYTHEWSEYMNIWGTFDVRILHFVNETSEIMNYLKIGPQNQNDYTQHLHVCKIYTFKWWAITFQPFLHLLCQPYTNIEKCPFREGGK